MTTQMDFNFVAGAGTPQVDRHPLPDRSLTLIGGTPDEIALVLHNDAVAHRREPDCTISICEGSTRRAIFIRETEHGRCQICFPGSTYSDGSPRIQTLLRQVVTRDGESR
jgi:hypothetical protein